MHRSQMAAPDHRKSWPPSSAAPPQVPANGSISTPGIRATTAAASSDARRGPLPPGPAPCHLAPLQRPDPPPHRHRNHPERRRDLLLGRRSQPRRAQAHRGRPPPRLIPGVPAKVAIPCTTTAQPAVGGISQGDRHLAPRDNATVPLYWRAAPAAVVDLAARNGRVHSLSSPTRVRIRPSRGCSAWRAVQVATPAGAVAAPLEHSRNFVPWCWPCCPAPGR